MDSQAKRRTGNILLAVAALIMLVTLVVAVADDTAARGKAWLMIGLIAALPLWVASLIMRFGSKRSGHS